MSSYWRLQNALVIAASVPLLPLMAAADAGVDWRAPAECPSALDARAEIAELMQRDLQSLPREARAQVVIRRVAPALLEARVAVHAGRGVREHVLRDASCPALTHAAALVVALALDPSAASAQIDSPAPVASEAARRAEPPALPITAEPSEARVGQRATNAERANDIEALRAPEPEAQARVQPRESTPPPEPEAEALERPAEADASQEPARARKLGAFLGIAAGLSAGIVPHLAPTAAIGGGLSLDSLSIALRLGFTPQQHAALAEVADAGGDVSLAYAALEVGARARAPSLELPIVAGIESGFFSSRGAGAVVPEQQTRHAAWLAAYLSVGVSHTWNDRLRLGLRVDGLLAFLRPRFALDVGTAEPAVFHRPKLVGARSYVTFDVLFE